MRAGEGDFASWRNQPEHPMQGGGKWATCFSNFRLAVPILAGFKGRAIYLDSDMLVLGDVAELLDLPIVPGKVWLCTSQKRTDVSVFDCEELGWPTLQELQESAQTLYHWRHWANRLGLLDCSLPDEWNCVDGWGYVHGQTKLVHFSDMKTQPWRPWPEHIAYQDHAWKQGVKLWQEEREHALAKR
jgi:hypothetical protein